MEQGARDLKTALSDRYVIERELGAGGMATVYLADDVRHDRKVALKVLRPELAAVIGAERFLHEIKTTANLQHPHILPLFDSGEADSFLFYVMPYVEGESLRDKLAREKQLGVEEAIDITRAVASALDYAHRHKVIHRDIKPENILLHDGQALVADFGIALAVSQAGATRLTETGLSLGTPHYMSPEQAMGDRSVDARSDIYSLGAMLFEMLTGDPPYTGSTAQAIVAKVITEPAPLVSLARPATPEHVVASVQKALEKLPADRFHTAAEFGEAISGRGVVPSPPPPLSTHGTGVRTASGSRRLPSWVVPVGVVATAAAAAAGWIARGGSIEPPAREIVRFAFPIGEEFLEGRAGLAISPDGRRIALGGDVNLSRKSLTVRDLASTEVRPIPGTEGSRFQTFSPDGEWLTFNRNDSLIKIPSRGGPSTTLTDDVTDGGSWTPDEHIVYTRSSDLGLSRVSSGGGEPERLTTPDSARREFAHWRPDVLPSGKAVLYTNYSTPLERSRIEAYEFSTGKSTVLIEGAIFGRYATSGHLLFVRDGAVFAVRFDTAKLEVSGPEVPVLEDISWDPTTGRASFALAPNGTLVYIKASEARRETRLVWVDRSGREEEAFPIRGLFSEPRISPDGRRIALTITEGSFPMLGLADLSRGLLTTLVRHQGAAWSPVWTPDGGSIIYAHESPAYDIHRVPVDGSGPSEPLITSPTDKEPTSIAAATGLLAYTETFGRADRIMLAPLDGSGPGRQLDSTMIGSAGDISPDGRWIAYVSRVDGTDQVFVRAVDGSGGRMQVSVAGGTEPIWTRGGRELVYRQDDAMVAVSTNPTSGDFGRPATLFSGPYGTATSRSYDVTPDGNRFLMVRPVERPGALPVVVVLNWLEELKEKMGN